MSVTLGALRVKLLVHSCQQWYPLNNREVKQLKRPRRRRQLQKTIGLMIKTTALHVHHAFKYISLTSTARLRRETS